MNPFVQRMVRAAKLDVTLYEEVEANKEAMTEALGVVLLASAASGLANLSRDGLGGLVSGAVWSVVAWLVASLVIYYVGTRWFADQHTQADYGQLLRTLGFAASPGIIRIVGILDPLRALAFWVASLWMIATTVVAVRQALDYSTTSRAVIVCIMGFFIQIVVAWLFLWAGCGRVL